MALAMRDGVRRAAGQWKKRGYDLDLGIGIAQGYATLGAIGFEGRWDYGAIGTVTNLAARLCSEAKPGRSSCRSACWATVEDAGRGGASRRAHPEGFLEARARLQRPQIFRLRPAQ